MNDKYKCKLVIGQIVIWDKGRKAVKERVAKDLRQEHDNAHVDAEEPSVAGAKQVQECPAGQ